MKLFIFLIMFLFIGAFFIISQNNLALGNEGAFKSFVSLYENWLDRVYQNTLGISAYVAKLEWMPE